ncbi:MAG: PDDEXK nuclease domain-containing protein [Elusimicrobia bacterium]|nr:PDDEXK nuclease domain-containing protein [Elusimicrobiota bacterium]
MKISKDFKFQFLEVVNIIRKARYNAIKNVNAELVNLYWTIGGYISDKLKSAQWGDAVVEQLSEYIQGNHPEFKGFTRRGLYRMRQFYDAYNGNQIVLPLVTQLSWTNHLIILSKTKTDEERGFYIKLSIKENYTKRELERQMDSGYYERAMLSNKKMSPVLTQRHSDVTNAFKDTYVLDFLNLPKTYGEKDLQQSIVSNLKHFILEFGKDFAFIGQEYRVQVGKSDYFVDLLFFHRGLKCLVMVELKIDDFKPEYLGKLNFYLEALDRDIKKADENPSVGIILCKSKDDEVVKYALSRNLSPALVSEYKTKLIPKKMLQKKLREYFLLENAGMGNSK